MSRLTATTDLELLLEQPGPIRTASGQPVWYRDPSRTQVLSADLRMHLGRQRRYAGAIEWTVLQHLALCSAMAAPHGPVVQAYAAAHDLHEAYVPDLPWALCRMIEGWAELEASWAAHVHRALALPWPAPEQVRDLVSAIDRRAIVLEVHAVPAPVELREEAIRTLGGPPTRHELELARHHVIQPAGAWRKVSGAIASGVQVLEQLAARAGSP